VVTLDRFGGLGAILVRNLRKVGFDDIGIWNLGTTARWAFRFLAAAWGAMPRPLRRLLPFQIIAMMSVRSHHWSLAYQGYSGLAGLMRNCSSLFVHAAHTEHFSRPGSRGRRIVGYLSKPQARTPPDEFFSAINQSVVISGGHDSTFPYQWDTRYELFPSEATEALIKRIEQSSFIRWYAENLTLEHPRFSPIPGGVLPSPWRDSVRVVRTRPKVRRDRKLALCAHRDRGGQRSVAQFDYRRTVTSLSLGAWKDFTHVPDDYMSIRSFREELRNHPFTLCVEGGGIDPSPKAFEALQQGSIPIIRELPISDAYRHFPVVVVKDWSEGSLSQTFLESELERVALDWPDWFEVIQRLDIGYWLNLIRDGKDTRELS
jgi:hypothetical protein